MIVVLTNIHMRHKMNLKDLKLNDLIKIALTVTAIVALTFNFSLWSNNTTIINNYIQETNKKLEKQDTKLDDLKIAADDIQGNTTQVESTINKTLALSKQILNEVN